jgi:hypothetical protein
MPVSPPRRAPGLAGGAAGGVAGGAVGCPGEEELERRRAAAARAVLLGTLGFLFTAALVGTVVGLAAGSAGWGLVGGVAFLACELAVAVAALAAQGQLRGSGRLYVRAVRRALEGSRAG